jgi:hypothetical protein
MGSLILREERRLNGTCLEKKHTDKYLRLGINKYQAMQGIM